MSWVFLAGRRVYKLKKPVRHDFLDFSTLEARAHFVHEEVRLNRRLARDVYLGATALSADAGGALSLDGPGETVDWLVTMRRLPGTRAMDAMIARNALTPAMVEQVGQRLAAFYCAAPPENLVPQEAVESFRERHEITARTLRDPALGLAQEAAEALACFETRFDRVAPLLEARARDGRIIEGHGDLRPEHVYLSAPVAIIDCLEFNRALRLVDPFDELAYFGMECARLGADWVGPLARRIVAEALDDTPPREIEEFYWSYRALLRARLALAHLSEPEPRKPRKWRPLARRYLALSLAPRLTPSDRRNR